MNWFKLLDDVDVSCVSQQFFNNIGASWIKCLAQGHNAMPLLILELMNPSIPSLTFYQLSQCTPQDEFRKKSVRKFRINTTG